MAGQYTCWNCGLKMGDEDAPQLPSQLCSSCKQAKEETKTSYYPWRD